MADDHPAYRFRTRLWIYPGQAGWHFVTLPHDVADEIEELTTPTRRGFGSVRVQATIGATTWQTSIFPDTKAESYVLPVKKPVRLSEGLAAEDWADVTLRLAE